MELGLKEEEIKLKPYSLDEARLEMKIMWLRSVVDKDSLLEAIKL